MSAILSESYDRAGMPQWTKTNGGNPVYKTICNRFCLFSRLWFHDRQIQADIGGRPLHMTLPNTCKAMEGFASVLCWLISDQVKGSNPVQDGGNLKAKDLGAELARIEMEATDEWWLLKIWGLIFWGSKHWLIQIDQNQLWDHGMNLRWLDSMAFLYFRWSKIGETDLWLSTRVRSLKNSRDEYTLYLHRGASCMIQI